MKQIILALLFPAAFSIYSAAQNPPKVDFAKKIEEAAPKALSQSPAAKKLKSDAQDRNLKGRVKSVVEYIQISGENVRLHYSDEFYDESGNLIKEVSYSEGYPTSVKVWGHIDGNRVSKSRSIIYTAEERPPSSRLRISVNAAPDNPTNPNAPTDERYSMKHVYKYDAQGRLAEHREYRNNGEARGRTVYEYKGNQRIELYYGSNDALWSRTVEILDNGGNVVERNLMVSEEEVGDREIQAYEFDKHGNWIVQKTFEEKTENGKAVRSLLWTSYRTITYYP